MTGEELYEIVKLATENGNFIQFQNLHERTQARWQAAAIDITQRVYDTTEDYVRVLETELDYLRDELDRAGE